MDAEVRQTRWDWRQHWHLTLCRAHISHYDGSFRMAVRRCFSFSDVNTTVELVDGRGCPDPAIMSQFSYDSLTPKEQPSPFPV